MTTGIEKFKERYSTNTHSVSVGNPAIDNFKKRFAAKNTDNWISNTSKVLDDVYSYLDKKGTSYVSASEAQEYYNKISTEVDNLLKDSTADKYMSTLGDDYINKSTDLRKMLSSAKDYVGKQVDYWSKFTSEEEYKNSPEYYGAVTTLPDFKKIADEVNKSDELDNHGDVAKTIASNTWSLAGTGIFGGKAKANAEAKAVERAEKTALELLGEELTDQEKQIYDYVYSTGGKDASDKYLASLRNELNIRTGETIAANSDTFGENLEMALEGGLAQPIKNTAAIFAKDPIPYSPREIASSIKSGELKGTAAGVVYDLTVTTANMLPSILLSYATGLPIAGAAFMGTTAGGNAYNQARLEGKSDEEAAIYGIGIGVLEAGLQYAIGGVSKLGGKAISNVGLTAIQRINNVWLRIAADIGKASASEGFEEYLQDIINPVLRNVVFDENNEFKLFTEDALYSALLGALSGGLLESGSIAMNDIQYNTVGKKLIQEGRVQNVIDAGLAFGNTSNTENLNKKSTKIAKEINKFATKLNSKTIPSSAINIGTLSSLIDTYIVATKQENMQLKQGAITKPQTTYKGAETGIVAPPSKAMESRVIQTAQDEVRNEIDNEEQDLAEADENALTASEEISDNNNRAVSNRDTGEPVTISRYEASDDGLVIVLEDGTKMLPIDIVQEHPDDNAALRYAQAIEIGSPEFAAVYMNNYKAQDPKTYDMAFYSIVDGVANGLTIDEIKNKSVSVSLLDDADIQTLYNEITKVRGNKLAVEAVKEEEVKPATETKKTEKTVVKETKAEPIKEVKKTEVKKETPVKEVKKVGRNNNITQKVSIIDDKFEYAGTTNNIIQNSFERANDSAYNDKYTIVGKLEDGTVVHLFNIKYENDNYNDIRDYTQGLVKYGMFDLGLVFINNYAGSYTKSSVYINAFNSILDGIINNETLDNLKTYNSDVLTMVAMNEATVDNLYSSLKKLFDRDSDMYDNVPAKMKRYKEAEQSIKKVGINPTLKAVGIKPVEEHTVNVKEVLAHTDLDDNNIFFSNANNGRKGGRDIILADKNLTDFQKASLVALKKIGEKYGLQFLVTDKDIGQDKDRSLYEKGTNVIVLSAKSIKDGVLLQYASMEAFNYLDSINHAAAVEIQNEIITRMKKLYPKVYASARTAALCVATESEVDRYIASSSLMNAFSSDKFIMDMFIADRELFAKINSWLQDFIAFINKAIKTLKDSFPAVGYLKKDLAFISSVNKKFRNALLSTNNMKLRKSDSIFKEEFNIAKAKPTEYAGAVSTKPVNPIKSKPVKKLESTIPRVSTEANIDKENKEYYKTRKVSEEELKEITSIEKTAKKDFDSIAKEYNVTPETIAEEERKEREELARENKRIETLDKITDTEEQYIEAAIEEAALDDSTSDEEYWLQIDQGSKWENRVKGAELMLSEGYSMNTPSTASFAILDSYGTAFGIRFIITDRPISASDNTVGTYFKGTNYVLLRTTNGQVSLLQVAGHELFHYLKDAWPEAGESIQLSIINKLKLQGDYGVNYAEYSKLYSNKTSRVEEESVRDYIEEEITAEAFLGLLEHEGYIKEFVRDYGDYSLGDLTWFVEYLIHIVSNKKFTYYEDNTYYVAAEKRKIIRDIKYLNKIHENMINALLEVRSTPLVSIFEGESFVIHNIERNRPPVLAVCKTETMDKIYNAPNISIYDKYTDDQVAATETLLTDVFSDIKTYTPTEKSVEDLFTKVTDGLDTKLSRAEFVRMVKPILNAMTTAKESTIKEMTILMADAIGRLIYKSTSVDKALYDMTRDAREYIGGITVALTQAQKDALVDRFGSYNRYRQSMFGWTDISDKGLPVDEVWAAIKSMHPEYVSTMDETKPSAELIYDFLTETKPIYTGLDERMGMKINDLAHELTMKVFSSYAETYAEKMQDKEKTALFNKIATLNQRIIDMRINNKEKIDSMYKAYMKSKKAFKAKIRESYEKREVFARIQEIAKDLNHTLVKPNRNKYIPEILKAPVMNLLLSLDLMTTKKNYKFATKRQEYWLKAIVNMKEAINQMSNDTAVKSFSLPPNLQAELDSIAAAFAGTGSIVDMTLGQMKEIRNMLLEVKSLVNSVNILYVNGRYESINELGSETIKDLESVSAIESDNDWVRKIGGFMKFENSDSFTFASKVGKAGATVFDALYKGFNGRVWDIEEAHKYFEKEVKPYIDESWSDSKKLTTFQFEHGTISLTTTQMMSFYELSKREQALKHMTKGGIISDLKMMKPTSENKAQNLTPTQLTEGDIFDIGNSLTDTQRYVADKIQWFFQNVTSRWGNEASMKIWGYKAFTEPNTFPIHSSKDFVKTKSLRNATDAEFTATLNQSFTKETVENASNPIVITDIFDEFTNHVIGMASYHNYSAPLLDALSWFNYNDGVNSVKLSLKKALGSGAESFVKQLLIDINGEKNFNTSVIINSGLIANYKAAAVGLNLRVAVQQPTSYIRALAVIDGVYLTKAMAMKPLIKEMQEHSAIGKWKSYGFLENSLGHSLKETLVGFEGDTKYEKALSKIKKVSLAAPQFADNVTWGVLWNACKLMINDTTKNEIGSKEYFNEVDKLFDVVINETQVVDTVFHRTQLMRSTDQLSRIFTAFMSEPAKIYNMVMRSVAEYSRDKSTTTKIKLVRSAVGLLLSITANVMIKSFVDVLRDDDKDTFIQKYIKAAKENALEDFSPINYIPMLRDVNAFIQGYDASRFDMQGIQYIVYGATELYKIASGAGGDWARAFQNTARGLSYVSGVPFYSLWRDLSAIYTSIKGKSYSSMAYKEKYDNMYDYLNDGNKDKYTEYVGKLIAEGKTMGDITTGLGTVMFEKEPSIILLADYKTSGATENYKRVFDSLLSKGFPFDAINKAVNKQINAVKDEDDSSVSSPSEEDFASIYNTSMLVKEIESGDLASMKTIKDDLIKNGKSLTSIKTAITQYFKPMLIKLNESGNTKEIYRIREILVSEFGYSRADIADWLK